MNKIGFIGLGHMGKPMAKNLLKADYNLAVYDIAVSAMQELENLGASTKKSAKLVAEESDVIITMLPNSPDVEKVILGPEGVLEGAHRGSLVIDMSSIAPGISKRIEAKVREKGVGMIDAPVTGGTIGAEKGTLTIMVGGDKADVARAMFILEKLGEKIYHVGEIGMGQTAKICNQIVVGLSFCAVSEAMVLGTKAGIDPVLLQQILNASGAAHCYALDKRVPLVLEGNFEPGFMIDLQHKDLGLSLEAGKELHVPLVFSSIAYQAYEAARAQGLGKKDHSAVIQVLENLTDAYVRRGDKI